MPHASSLQTLHLHRLSGGTPGDGILSLAQCWQLALPRYSPDWREPDWRRKTIEEVEQLFAEIGLAGEFWALR